MATSFLKYLSVFLNMDTAPAPFSEIGKQVKDVLTKDYNFDNKFTFSVPTSSGMELTATGARIDHIFVGDISTRYKSGNTTVDVKYDSDSYISTKVTVNDAFAFAKAALSFEIPDHKSGKLVVHYLLKHAAIDASIGLHPTPVLEVAATVGNKDLSFGGEFAWDTTASSFTKYSVGIGLSNADFSVALILMDKGQSLKISYIHNMNLAKQTAVGAEMTHRLSSYENSTFTLGISHAINPCTRIKTRFSDTGKIAMLCEREWRPKSVVTFSAEYDSKAVDNATPKVGIALALQP